MFLGRLASTLATQEKRTSREHYDLFPSVIPGGADAGMVVAISTRTPTSHQSSDSPGIVPGKKRTLGRPITLCVCILQLCEVE